MASKTLSTKLPEWRQPTTVRSTTALQLGSQKYLELSLLRFNESLPPPPSASILNLTGSANLDRNRIDQTELINFAL